MKLKSYLFISALNTIILRSVLFIHSLTLCCEMQSGGLYRPPSWRRELRPSLTSSIVRVESNSTCRGPTRFGGMSGQDPKVFFVGATIFWLVSVVSIFPLSCFSCFVVIWERVSFPFATLRGWVGKVRVQLWLWSRSRVKHTSPSTIKRVRILKSLFSIFAIPVGQCCVLISSRVSLPPVICKSNVFQCSTQKQPDRFFIFFHQPPWSRQQTRLGCTPYVNNWWCFTSCVSTNPESIVWFS